MITKFLITIFKLRVRLMRLSANNSIVWQKSGIAIRKSIYRTLNSNIILVFFCAYAISAALNSTEFFYNRTITDDENYREVRSWFTKRIKLNRTFLDESILALLGFMHIVSAITSILALVALISVRNKLCVIVTLFNMSTDFDSSNQAEFSRLVHAYPNTSREFKLRPYMINGLGIMIAAILTVSPLSFGLIALQPLSPIRKSIVESLEIFPKVELKYAPITLFIFYVVFMVCDAIFLLAYVAYLYLLSAEYWLTQLCPVDVLKKPSILNGDKELVLRCKNGRIIGFRNLIRFYRCYEILTNAFNNVYANFIITMHHSCFVFILSSALFLGIRYTEMFLLPGGQVIPVAIIAIVMMEFFETVLIVGMQRASKKFLSQLREHTRKKQLHGEKLAAKNIRRELASLSSLHAHTAYPVLSLSKQYFLEFLGTSIETVVDMLIMV
ncbi:unnamed protein product [Orchesella dallaii]|uniref:Odorant receptor n=1 Tax=Orchesella dallaii TaxID=48710 RepID=A0ABP1PHU4_9HEXA